MVIDIDKFYYFANLGKLLEKKDKSIYNITGLEKGISVGTKEKMEV